MDISSLGITNTDSTPNRPMTLEQLNRLSQFESQTLFEQCCTASRWVELMVQSAPYASIEQLKACAEAHWETMVTDDYLQAFDGHPKIGDPASLKAKYAATHATASDEQSSVNHASDETINELAHYNELYEQKFGFIFIVCATGKSADEMLDLVKARIHNPADEEILIAAGEQLKILLIRIDKQIAA